MNRFIEQLAKLNHARRRRNGRWCVKIIVRPYSFASSILNASRHEPDTHPAALLSANGKDPSTEQDAWVGGLCCGGSQC